MKLSMQLTLDGLIRALRIRGHALAEEAQSRKRARREALPPRQAMKRDRRTSDDRAGR